MIFKKIKKLVSFFTILLFVFSYSYSLIPGFQNISPEIKNAQASNYLANSSFTGGSTGWTLSGIVYDSAYYSDTAGSVKGASSVGRNNSSTGFAEQTISTSIGSDDAVLLSFAWSKQCVAVSCVTNDIYI